MSNLPRPKDPLLRFLRVNSADELWQKVLTEGEPVDKYTHHFFGLLPSNPRCKYCHGPFTGIGGALMRILGIRQSSKNPQFCTACDVFTGKYRGGAEVEVTMLFVDVRGSTTLAEKMNATEFSRLMNRFYDAAINVLVHADAFIDKLVGDEVTALFVPGFAGKAHARRAIDAGQALLRVTGYGDPGGPWVPIGVGVHTGLAYVGSIAGASGASSDFTALGDNVNITARLASKAGPGEVLVSEAACNAAQIETAELERRELELKGKSESVSVRVLHVR